MYRQLLFSVKVWICWILLLWYLKATAWLPCSVVPVKFLTEWEVFLAVSYTHLCNQVENAGAIVLSRTKGMSEGKLAACVDMLREHNKDAVIVTTPWDELDGKTRCV